MTKILSISKWLVIKQFAVYLLLLVFVSPIKSQDIANKPKGFTSKRHSITPMFAIANNFTTPFSISPNPSLRVSNINGDEIRTPLSIRYQYRMRHGIQLGADFLVNYNPMGLKPEFDTQYGYVGPVIPTDGNLLGGDFHVSKTIKVKIIEAFGYVGIGGYSQRVDNSLTKDYSWFRNAPSEFYDFAVASTNNVTRKFLPITKFGIGVRLKHLEIGVNREYSLVSPVKSFTYEGVNYENKAARFKSLSFHIGYRYEF
jgi:hypothetical protein